MYFTGSGIIAAKTHCHHLGLMRIQHHEGEDLHKPIETLTFCVLVLENGFTVTGESACASPENFDAEIGRKIAFEKARNKIWQLEGDLLKQSLCCTNTTVNFAESLAKGVCGEPSSSGREERLNNRETAYMLTQLINTPTASKALRTKAENKLSELIDKLI